MSDDDRTNIEGSAKNDYFIHYAIDTGDRVSDRATVGMSSETEGHEQSECKAERSFKIHHQTLRLLHPHLQ
jgi:hypothetical protein